MAGKKSPDAARRSDRSRRAILSAVLQLVNEVGYGEVSIEGIASRAGVGKQTIYRWWPSKGAVLLEAFVTSGGEGPKEPAPLPDTGDIETDLKNALRATVAEMMDSRFDEPVRALHIEMLQDSKLAATAAEQWDEPRNEVRKERLRSAQRLGQLPDNLDLDLAVEMLWGPLLNRWLQQRKPLSSDYADNVVEVALNGLRRPIGVNGQSPHPQSPDIL
ncbi:MAG TPA: TetR/AcrR family transcriptional regulator [Actinomycetota bacterium]|nr:TetR/AcrR family transcriptional regulator [Actinomycetota bacterium]